MKFNKIIFAIIILIISMSFVSAQDNITSDIIQENYTQMEDTEIASEINVTFSEKVYRGDLGDIEVEIPENTSGNLEVKINDYTLFNESVNTSQSIPIKLPPQKFPMVVANVWPPFDVSRYEVSAFFNNVELNITHDLQVMLYPKDYVPSFLIPEEVLQFSKSYLFMPAVLFPRSATGSAEIYLDGKLINRTDVKGPFVYLNSTMITSLSLGTHKLLLNYSGDDYFNSCSEILIFNVTDAVIHIPKSIYLDHDDCISVNTLKTGYITVYVDSKPVKNESIDKNGEFIYSLFNDISCGQHEIMVEVLAKNFTRTKKASVNVTYSIDIENYLIYRYGMKDEVSVYIPDDMSLNLFRVTVNNTEVPVKKIDNFLMIDISKLDAGNYTINVTYLGDEKYYPMSVNDTFMIDYEIDVPYFVDFNGEQFCDIILPADAKGNLNIYIDGKLYKSSELVNGKASVLMGNLNPGQYNVTARYTGTDYTVREINYTMTMYPDIFYQSSVRVGDENILYFEVPKNCKGKILLNAGSRTYAATIKNGLATIDLSKLEVGVWDMDLYYVGADGYNNSYYVGVFVENAPIKIKPLNTKMYYTTGSYKVRVIGKDGKIVKNGAVTFKINGRTLKTVKTNSQGIASVKIPAKYSPKTYVITASYKTAKISKKVCVNHILKLAVHKKGSKLILKAKAIKGKIIKFKINGKIINAKTNRYGIAKLIVKKPKAKKAIVRATYLKDSVIKTVKL